MSSVMGTWAGPIIAVMPLVTAVVVPLVIGACRGRRDHRRGQR